MTRAPDTHVPDWLTSRAYRCDICGEDAGQLELQFYRGFDDVTLVIDGIVGQTTTWLSQASAKQLEKVLEGGLARELFDVDDEWASFYCPDCQRTYCSKHWLTQIVFDDDPSMPGWYDFTYGTCPSGHQRIVDD